MSASSCWRTASVTGSAGRPRGRSGGVVSVRGRPRQRVFWRDLHAVTGAVAGVLILFIAGSGLFWSGYWGDKFMQARRMDL